MKTNTKDIFIDTASSLFANQGYHATGILDSLAPATVYRLVLRTRHGVKFR